MIKTFAEYQVDINQLFNSEAAYNAGVKEASAFFEEENQVLKEEIQDITEEYGKLEELNDTLKVPASEKEKKNV